MDSWSPAAPGELSTQSEEFRTRSAAQNVRLHQTGAKHVHHPVVGDLSLAFEMLELRAAACPTAISCRGHEYDGAWANCPTVLFSADAPRAAMVEEIARASGCGLISNDSGDLELWAPSVEEVWQFTELLLARRNELDALPDADALREARASARTDDEDEEWWDAES